MTTPEEEQTVPEGIQETVGLRPESAGGAGMGEEGAPIGFGAEVGGVAAPTTDDPAEARELALGALRRRPDDDG
jgi:hypothetical protein